TRKGANLNTATFDKRGRIWFTGQSGIYGRLDPATGDMKVWDSPRGRGPYGIATTPGGDVYYASLAGNYIARVDLETGAATVIEPPTRDQGARRVWADTTRRSLPDSGAQTSPGRPRIWRTLAPRLSLGNTWNFSVAGSKRTMALALHSLSHTTSCSSTYTAYARGLSPGRCHVFHVLAVGS